MYPDRDTCIGAGCVWYDVKTRSCFIESPSVQPQRSWKHESRLEHAGKRQAVYNIIHKLNSLEIRRLRQEAVKERITQRELKEILGELEEKGLVYAPKPGFVSCVDD
ncbi:MAG TPA: hypothetical protein ENN13_04785 [Candidatus Altiarchaeales archaeon]|nr:hypothetical protein [Candidatus Altiarchaeales archaeon]